MLICCEWAFGCTLTLLRLCRSGVDFWINGVWLSLSDVVMSWLRPQNPMNCIPHPYHIYTRCFSTLICCEWAYGSTLTLLCLCMGRGGFLEIWVGLSPSDVAMSWLRLQTPVDCIPHPYCMYTKCFSTLICCGWAYKTVKVETNTWHFGGIKKTGQTVIWVSYISVGWWKPSRRSNLSKNGWCHYVFRII